MMDINEKVEQQYKLVEAYNQKDDDVKMSLGVLEDLIEDLKSGERDSMVVMDEMKQAFDEMYFYEIEKKTLANALRIISK